MFQNRVLRKTFGPQVGASAREGLKKLHTVAFYNMYPSSPPPPNIMR